MTTQTPSPKILTVKIYKLGWILSHILFHMFAYSPSKQWQSILKTILEQYLKTNFWCKWKFLRDLSHKIWMWRTCNRIYYLFYFGFKSLTVLLLYVVWFNSKMPEREDDQLTPATRLLEKRREMSEVEQALTAQKEVCARILIKNRSQFSHSSSSNLKTNFLIPLLAKCHSDPLTCVDG